MEKATIDIHIFFAWARKSRRKIGFSLIFVGKMVICAAKENANTK